LRALRQIEAAERVFPNPHAGFRPIAGRIEQNHFGTALVDVVLIAIGFERWRPGVNLDVAVDCRRRGAEVVRGNRDRELRRAILEASDILRSSGEPEIRWRLVTS